jgi:hypothetical protein
MRAAIACTTGTHDYFSDSGRPDKTHLAPQKPSKLLMNSLSA